MNAYYLRPPGVQPKHVLDNPYGSSHLITVRDGDYYAARMRAFDHAAEAGARWCFVVVGACTVHRVRSSRGSGNRPLETLQVPAPSNHTDHGLLLYLRRLLGAHAGAVRVPPLGAVPQLPRGWVEQTPTIPMVSAYSVSAVKSVDATGPSLGYNLVSAGYRVLTLGDYAHIKTGPVVLDDWGSTTTWKKAYDHALTEFL